MSQIIYIFLILVNITSLVEEIGAIQPALIVHGGAGTISSDRFKAKLDGMKESIRVGYQILLDMDDPMGAVEKAVNVMENDAAFNAGRGSVQTETGEVEMDAAIVNGTSLEVGAVGALRHIRNPISLARLVMQNTSHVFIVGQFAEEFAVSQGIELVPTEELIVNLTYYYRVKRSSDFDVGTVGAVAINSKGQIAAATSTGGMSGKMNGRVGDTPIIGGGTLADDEIGGFSATGAGEAFIRYRVTSRIANLVENGVHPSDAMHTVLTGMTEKIPEADGGVIGISKDGTVGFNWNSEQMAWAYVQSDVIYSGIEKGDNFTEPWVPATVPTTVTVTVPSTVTDTVPSTVTVTVTDTVPSTVPVTEASLPPSSTPLRNSETKIKCHISLFVFVGLFICINLQ